MKIFHVFFLKQISSLFVVVYEEKMHSRSTYSSLRTTCQNNFLFSRVNSVAKMFSLPDVWKKKYETKACGIRLRVGRNER